MKIIGPVVYLFVLARDHVPHIGLLVYVFLVFQQLFYEGPPPRHVFTESRVDSLVSLVGKGTCQLDINKLGHVSLDIFNDPNITAIEEDYKKMGVASGGMWSPKDCKAWQKVAILIPYRDRLHHLKLLLQRLHPMLQRQMLQYQIFVVEQAGESAFNRGKLLNVAVKEALKVQPFDCFVFHDVDLIPEDDRNLYYCDPHLRHLASAIDEVRYGVIYSNYAGGVAAMSNYTFHKINGYPNTYWGWGGEDDDFSARSREMEVPLTRPPKRIGHYKMVRHVKAGRNSGIMDQFLTWRSRWKTDGIMSTGQESFYQVKVKQMKPLFTYILADLGEPPPEPPFNQDTPRESSHWLFRFYHP